MTKANKQNKDQDANPWIIDTTLRDGEQAPGVVFSPAEKMRIARMLSETGIDELEIGYPAISDEERQVIRAISRLGLPLRLTSWARAVWQDIEHAAACGTEAVHISFPLSGLYLELMGQNYQWVQEQMHDLVPRAKRLFSYVSVGAQDATRAETKLLRAFFHDAAASGADRVRIADTVGVATPGSIMAMIGTIRTSGHLPIEFHAHNDLGMATANAFTALEAGCAAVSVSVTGLGERAGNAALEELAIALELSGRFRTRIDNSRLAGLCETVSRASGRPIQEQKPVVGKSAFQHESGIHCAALLKHPLSYQPFLPEQVGRTNSEMVIGKHSGSAAIHHFYSTHGINISKEESAKLLQVVRKTSGRKKRALTEQELKTIYRSYHETKITLP
ncbi:MAG: homocitrate synthase [Chlorobium sp.]|jgi:homocitrate synthase NifV|uniref:homocitrate synthase n=1 Tax=Chlorobium sp. TaxID=1095 RepID=UPI001DAB7E29|nr:homocitrate synthase [Chlorobium sp.]MBN1279328.1 homocitrate synthase [Chlorobiaceae bacterium]MCF8215679.1 homocitrate synthase [Chlorobium sp.]MCF8271922.1 homocitrate synthase [Chlorobium sp.]MCF8286888.1 homocitrate synthase [Chlorobium sp.]MCF8291869.1 homocitrate synthase [Chlorobium sp.]